MSASSTKNKERERFFVERLRHARPDLFSGAIRPREKPDFEFSGSDGTVGLEVTELYFSQSQKRTEGEVQIVLSRAADIAASKGCPPLQVCVSVSDDHAPAKADRESNAQLLSGLVMTNLPQSSSPQRVIDQELCRPSELFRTVDICLLQSDASPLWTTVRCGLAHSQFRADLEERVTVKDAKRAHYVGCDQYWLLIAVPGDDISSFVDLDAADLRKPYATGYDRVFLLEGFAAKAIELPLAAT